MFPQKLNPNYRVNDFKTTQNRYELMPDGYCVPVKYNSISPEDYYPGYRVHIEIDEILKFHLKNNENKNNERRTYKIPC